jgi:hypothetical protein
MCWHKWNKWETTKQGDIQVYYPKGFGYPENPLTMGIYAYQERICEKCGKKQIRRIETP